MRLLGIAHAIPKTRITTEDILAELRLRNTHLPPDHLSRIEATVLRFLATAGTEVRYVLAPGERAIDLAVQAGERALAHAGVSPDDVDFVIFCGVARGWLEPATASVIQAGLRIRNATSFDVSDGCASWIRSMEIAQRFVDAGPHRTGLIVNAECGLRTHADFRVTDMQDLKLRLAAFTIGEAATATVVGADVTRPWHFRFKTFSDDYDLSMLPLEGWESWALERPKVPYVSGRFFALSHELIPAVVRRIVEVFEADETLRAGTYDIVLGHAASERASDVVLKRLRLPHALYFPTHRRFGNTVSAATPLAISLALESERLQRGDQVLVIVGGAGISIGLATFQF